MPIDWSDPRWGDNERINKIRALEVEKNALSKQIADLNTTIQWQSVNNSGLASSIRQLQPVKVSAINIRDKAAQVKFSLQSDLSQLSQTKECLSKIVNTESESLSVMTSYLGDYNEYEES